jgi:hypothetical protein
MSYTPKFPEYMAEARVGLYDLPLDLQQLVNMFVQAKEVWEQNGEPKALLKILVQSDAYISGEIFSMFLKHQPANDIDLDKVKMMALKAKALKLKWNKK